MPAFSGTAAQKCKSGNAAGGEDLPRFEPILKAVDWRIDETMRRGDRKANSRATRSARGRTCGTFLRDLCFLL